MSSINQQLKKAIGLSLLGRYSAYVVQLALLMLYARWFTPEEYREIPLAGPHARLAAFVERIVE